MIWVKPQRGSFSTEFLIIFPLTLVATCLVITLVTLAFNRWNHIYLSQELAACKHSSLQASYCQELFKNRKRALKIELPWVTAFISESLPWAKPNFNQSHSFEKIPFQY